MNFLVAETFNASFSRLAGQDHKAVKASGFDLWIATWHGRSGILRAKNCGEGDQIFWK